MNTIWSIVMVAVVIIIGLMLQRVFQGPTIFDRMNGLGVIGADTILLLVLFGYVDGRPDMYVDIAISYAILGFICSVVVAKYLGGKNV
ncbi:MAG: pH regulation protein F [Peptococcaceae bacterium]|jgi:multicomponent Na+:H+ antiporter subunit F|nr:pH regulation protein F [Peptococcaceae bacterium]MBQ2014587.1 pH regulation protein F [Peptococcaceae bacterium]MBQ2015104.1 pH regulation protein F [Peptococcaceae bacterium]MBQ2035546.1 pH regulation protein F [Peptococcaceae bacterium]MBQ2119682.1 pH regulation protein F [Peptococcaceae bacterium]